MVGRFDLVKQGDLSGQDETTQGKKKVVFGRPHQNGPAAGPHRGQAEQTNRCHPSNDRPTGVRALIVARKPGNSGEAKECRKVDA